MNGIHYTYRHFTHHPSAICTFFAIILVFGTAITSIKVSASLQLPLLYVDPTPSTATYLGEIFTIDVNIANVSDLQYVEFKLGYNTTLLNATEATEGPFMKSFGGTWSWITINRTQGYIWITISIISGGPAVGNGTLATITFNATYYGSVSCPLNFYDTQLLDSNAQDIEPGLADGTYKFVFLNLTATTDRPSYLQGEMVQVSGNLTLDGLPADGLVALEVTNPTGLYFVLRTLQTGPDPPVTNVTLVDLIAARNYLGEPKNPPYNYTRDGFAYFKVIVQNSGTESKDVKISLTLYDKNSVPFISRHTGIPLAPESSAWFVFEMWIPEFAALGSAMAYASVFSDLPEYGGVAYCPEMSLAFNISGSGGGLGGGLGGGGGPIGNYDTSFRLWDYAQEGTYTVYVNSDYRRQHAENSTTFIRFAGHDIAITTIHLLFPEPYIGFPCDILVEVKNEGTEIETFTVTMYYENQTYNGTLGPKTVTNLASGISENVTFSWDLSSFSVGYYTLSANASVVPGENETSDNTYTHGSVKVKYPGDANGDGFIGGYDATVVSIAWWTRRGQPNYNPLADFNMDNFVGGYDATVVSIRWWTNVPKP